MFETRATDIITMLVNEYLIKEKLPHIARNDDGSLVTKGICIDLRIKAINPNDYSKKEFKEIKIIFMNNVSVFFALNKKEDGSRASCLNDIPTNNWINTCNHDSCWSSDGLNFIDDFYFSMCKNVAPNLAPINVLTSAEFGFCYNWPVEEVLITYKNDDRNYKKRIIKIEKCL